MPLTVTYAAIDHCMIETRTVFNPAWSLIHHCFTHVIHPGFRAQVAPASHRSACSWCLGPLYSNTSPPGLADLGGTTHVNCILGFGTVFFARARPPVQDNWQPCARYNVSIGSPGVPKRYENSRNINLLSHLCNHW